MRVANEARSRFALVDRLTRVTERIGDRCEIFVPEMIYFEPKARSSCSIRNTANLIGGENVGDTAAKPDAPEAASDDDDGGGGDGDPDSDRRPRIRKTRTRNMPPAAGSLPSTSAATPAPPHLDTLPDAAFVRLPEVCRLYAIAPATAWRWVKAGRIPAPLKLSDRVTAWRVGDLRASLAQLAA